MNWDFAQMLAVCKPRRYLLHTILALCLSIPLSAQTVQTESFLGREVVAGEVIVRFRDGAVQAAAIGQDLGVGGVRPLPLSRAMLLRSTNRSAAELVQQYSGRPDVLYAEPNYVWRKQDLPNDVFFDAQWALRNTGQFVATQTGTAGADIGAVQAWDITQGSRSHVVGIVDTGLDYNHPDLAANVWSAPSAFTVTIGGEIIACAAGTHGFNAVARTCDPMDDDVERHGSHVAGIIGADGDNGIGISGVSRVASMMALKFLRSDGNGTTADAIAAIEFAIQAKATFGAAANIRVLNNSWGGNNFSQALLDAIDAAANSEMLFVASAGNSGLDTDITAHYPSGYNAPNIISVAATDNRDGMYSFSNFGATTVHLGAPGRAIASTLPVMNYVFQTGTSMAAGMVSGAAHLVLSRCALTAAQLKTLLLGTVDPATALQSKTVTGGRLNVHNALANCAGTPTSFTLKSSTAFLTTPAGGTTSAAITFGPLNGFSSEVALAVEAPSGIDVSLGSSLLTTGSVSTSVMVTVDSNAAPGTYVVRVTGSGGGISRSAGFVVIVGNPIAPGQNQLGTWAVNLSQPDRFRPGNILPAGLMDWYHFTLSSTTTLDISLLSFSFQGNQLRLLNSNRTTLEATSTGINNTLRIIRTLAAGTYSIVVSTGLSGTSAYSLAVNAPQLRSLSPNNARQGVSVVVQFSGEQFSSGLTVDAGNDINVSNIVFNHAASAAATFNIAPNAVIGPRDISLTTASGTSNPLPFTVNPSGPIISSFSPSSGVLGTTVDLEINGVGFEGATVQAISSTVFFQNVSVVSTTLITARLVIPDTANPGFVTIQITTPFGLSTRAFQILPPPPVFTNITPPSGGLGNIVDVILTGENFFGQVTLEMGSGIDVSNVVVQSRTAATARLQILNTAAIGVRNVSIRTPGGTSGALLFTVTAGAPPTLTSITPATGAQTTTHQLNVQGTAFTAGLVFNAGADISVTDLDLLSLTRATVTIEIGAGAALGPRDITVSTPGGTSNALTFTVLIPPPTLTSITPNSGTQESISDVTLAGSNFVPGMTIDAGGQLPVSNLNILDSTSATATLTIPASVSASGHSIRVRTPSGLSGPVTFTVLPGIPSLTEIIPPLAVRGHFNQVTLNGRNFASPLTLSPIAGVSVTNVTQSGSSIGAFFNVDSAALGTYMLSVTTPGGTTNGLPFSVVDPFPDLRLSALPLHDFYAGLQGTYSVSVLNGGTAPAPSPIVVTDLLPPEFSFISGGGNGFECAAAGQLITCTYSGPPAFAGVRPSFNITVAVSAAAPNSVTHVLSVPYNGDLLPDNNSRSVGIPIRQVPVPLLSVSTTPVAQQGVVNVILPERLPSDVTGTLTLKFSSTALTPADDAAIAFASGGREVAFTIPANTLNARFGTALSAGPIQFQTGTVAGAISFDGTMRVDSVEKSFSSTAASSLTIAPAPPVISSVRTSTSGEFAALITSYSTPRSITQLTLQFVTTPLPQLSCGSVPGCTASGSTMVFDVGPLFDNWFAANPQFGSLTTLRVPLSIQGFIRGSVSVSLRNSLGGSNSIFFALP